MKKEHRYLKVTGGEILKQYDLLMSERRAQTSARSAAIEELGAQALFGNSRGCSGAMFKDKKPPEGWLKMARQTDCYRPPAGKKGKEWRERLISLKLFAAAEFHARIVPGSFGFIDIPQIRYVTPEKIGDVLVLLVPICEDGKNFNPPDTVPMKDSEYWTLKEAEADNSGK